MKEILLFFNYDILRYKMHQPINLIILGFNESKISKVMDELEKNIKVPKGHSDLDRCIKIQK